MCVTPDAASSAGRRLLFCCRQPLHRPHRQRVRRIDGQHAVALEEAEARDAEKRVEDVGLVARLVGDAAVLLVLAAEYKRAQGARVDPVLSLEEAEAREHPPE